MVVFGVNEFLQCFSRQKIGASKISLDSIFGKSEFLSRFSSNWVQSTDKKGIFIEMVGHQANGGCAVDCLLFTLEDPGLNPALLLNINFNKQIDARKI